MHDDMQTNSPVLLNCIQSSITIRPGHTAASTSSRYSVPE